jgi:hypothetical protein
LFETRLRPNNNSWDACSDDGLQRQVQAALQFREQLAQRCPSKVCAVCACGCATVQNDGKTTNITEMPLGNLPHKELLLAEREPPEGSTRDELPRHAWTRTVHLELKRSGTNPLPTLQPEAYCLHPDGTDLTWDRDAASRHIPLQELRICWAYAVQLGCPHYAKACDAAACAACSGVVPRLDLLMEAARKLHILARAQHALLASRSPAELALTAWRTSQRIVKVCSTCLGSLRNNRTPSDSLVRVDTGSVAMTRQPTMQLVPLNTTELIVLARFRAVRHLMVCR